MAKRSHSKKNPTLPGMMGNLPKQTKIEIKKLKKMAISDTFSIVRGRHIKVYLSMKDDSGNVKKLRFIFATTPGSHNWVKWHKKHKKTYLRENIISIAV